ncbi:MAG: glycosyltransferase, partial [Thermodesulfobacteria bacterium]|nr:glycosyltransferase [Thermodesulfobacteriota bacterium]
MENFLADLARAQVRRGDEVFVLAHEHRPFRRGGHTLWHGVRLKRVPILGELLYVPLAPGMPLAFRQALREFAPDVLHLHLPNPAAFFTLLLAPRLPVVVHWHADVVPSRLDRRLALAYRFYRP